ncbi:MAG TPA: PAS domain S-box protein, partial [Candidatus Deferrimicrobium sp.]|nr:PAS domain S-box protein [Candidatus Deferrimicrobium sp.]
MTLSEESYKNLVENAVDVIYKTDERGKIVFISQKIQQLFHISPDDVQGKFIMDLFSSLPLTNKKQQIKTLLDAFSKAVAEKNNEYSFFIHLNDDKEKYLQVNCRLIWDVKKKVLLSSEGIIRDLSEVHQLQQQIRMSEAGYQDLYDSAPVAYFSVSTEGFIKRANKTAEEFSGYPLEELQKMQVLDLYAEESKDKAKSLFMKFKQGNPLKNEEMIYKRKDGQKIYGLLSVNSITDATGQIIESRSVVVDISERKKIEDSLQISELTLRDRVKELQCLFEISQLFETSNISLDGILQKIVELIPLALQFPQLTCARILYMNKEYRTNKFIETEWKLAIHMKVNETDLKLEVYYAESKQFLHEEANLLKEIGIRLKNFLERKLTETMIRESEEKYRFLFEKAPFAIILIDVKGKLIDCNPALTEIFGILKEDVVGKTFLKLENIMYSSKDLPALMKRFEVMASGKIPSPLEMQVFKKDGTPLWVVNTISNVKLGNELIIQGIVQDITERKKAEDTQAQLLTMIQTRNEELIELDRLKDDFFADITHEFRTPLVAIKGFAELLLNSKNLDTLQQQDLETILRNEMHLERLINELLEYSRLKAGKVQFKKDKFTISKIINDLKIELEPLIQAKQLILEQNLTPDQELALDKYQITKVIKNLLSNAIKFSFPSHPIFLQSIIKEGVWTFSIRDEGVGIAENDIPKLFTRFIKL